MDKLDEMNRKISIHSNLIKWWDVNMLPAEESETMTEEDEGLDIDDSVVADNNYPDNNYPENNYPNEDMLYLDDLSDDAAREIAANALKQNDHSDAYSKAYFSMEVNDFQSKQDEANEIYERLMREAAEDEAKKQREIEEARLLAEANNL